ncbi:hypothetical protein Hypma_002628 [Hypsizygus marmoreus]|uniref:F-box domain-containing protein n=1 Tax=Hypsizygus marmoreus TaxID=39966 RepID=A0A369JAP2_HYPMA|nr:hypothetical protein Hypma_002628 [Hypsizygus marmoreus]
MALPPELTDQIIEHIEPCDKPTLFACALASRSLLAASRSRLLTNVSLRPGTTTDLAALISSPLCTLPTRIQSISIGDPSARFDSTDRECFPHVLAALTNLTTLVVSSYFKEPLPLDAVNPPRLSCLTCIELLGIRFESVGDAVAFVCAFPGLRTLLLLGVSWRTSTILGSLAPDTTPRLPRGLRTLRLMAGCEDFVRWVLDAHCSRDTTAANGLPPIETLTFDGVSNAETSAIYDLIGALEESLKSLSIYFKPNQATPEVTLCSHPGLATIPTLRIMRFSGMSIVRNSRRS